MKQIDNYLEGELSTTLNKASLDGLTKALDDVYNQKETSKETSEVPLNKRVKTNEASTSTENVPETKSSNQKVSDGLSPLDYVLEKQSSEPFDPSDDLD